MFATTQLLTELALILSLAMPADSTQNITPSISGLEMGARVGELYQGKSISNEYGVSLTAKAKAQLNGSSVSGDITYVQTKSFPYLKSSIQAQQANELGISSAKIQQVGKDVFAELNQTLVGISITASFGSATKLGESTYVIFSAGISNDTYSVTST